MRDEFILQTAGYSSINLDTLFMIALSTTTLSMKNKVVVNCTKEYADVMNKINFGNIEIYDDIVRIDNYVSKFDSMNKFKDELFIHVDLDSYYDEKISFDDNDIIVARYESFPREQMVDVYLNEFVTVIDDFPRVIDNEVYNYLHAVFGCKNKELMYEWLDNEKIHVAINNLDYSYPRANCVFYTIMEQVFFHHFAYNYKNLKIKYFEHELKGNYKHYWATEKYIREFKNDIVEKLKYYDLALYNRIIEYASSKEFINYIKNKTLKIGTNYGPTQNLIKPIEIINTDLSCSWYFSDIVFEDNMTFKFFENERDWQGYVLGENEINTIDPNKYILHPNTKIDDFIDNNCLVVKEKGIYDFELIFNAEIPYFTLKIFKK